MLMPSPVCPVLGALLGLLLPLSQLLPRPAAARFLGGPESRGVEQGHHCVHDTHPHATSPHDPRTRSRVEYARPPPPRLQLEQQQSEQQRLRRRLSSASPLRIYVDYSGLPHVGSANRTTLHDTIQNDLVPAAVAFWSGALLLPNPVADEALRFDRNCTHEFGPFGSGARAGGYTCSEFGRNVCGGEFDFPTAWLKAGTACGACNDDSTCTQCVDYPQGSGLGFAADYVLTVTAVDGPTCVESEDTLGYAAPCRYDQYDRPTMGSINFCPRALVDRSPATLQSTAKHELAHALGFTAEMMPYFRDAAGNPLTARDGTAAQLVPYTTDVQCANGATQDEPRPSAATTLEGPVNIRGFANGYRLKTPNIVVAARAHYGCETLTGAELENQPTGASACWGSHWEQRVTHTELMAPVAGPRSAVSLLTLAYFQDSGWYDVNFSKAESSPSFSWGRGQGCAFVDSPCVSEAGIPLGAGDRYFCATADEERCTFDLSSLGFCNRITYNGALPSPFQWFGTSGNLAKAGGSLAEMDYCPYYSGYSNGDCGDASNSRAADSNYFGERYGAGALCIASSLIWDGYSPKPVSQKTRCYGVSCSGSGEAAVVTITVSPESGFHVSVTCAAGEAGTAKSVAGFTGTLTCPDVTVACLAAADGGNFKATVTACPAKLNACSGNGVCVYTEPSNEGANGTYACHCLGGYSGHACEICDTEVNSCSRTLATGELGKQEGSGTPSARPRALLAAAAFAFAGAFVCFVQP